MRTNRNLLIVAAVVICSVLSVWFSTSIQGGSKTYEIRPQIAIPEYRTDAARAIDSYERMMELYMAWLTETSAKSTLMFRISSEKWSPSILN